MTVDNQNKDDMQFAASSSVARDVISAGVWSVVDLIEYSSMLNSTARRYCVIALGQSPGNTFAH